MINPFEEQDLLNLAFFFNPDGSLNTVVPGGKNELFLEVNIRRDTKDFYEKMIFCLDFLFKKMKEVSGNDFRDGFLGGDNDNDFF